MSVHCSLQSPHHEIVVRPLLELPLSALSQHTFELFAHALANLI